MAITITNKALQEFTDYWQAPVNKYIRLYSQKLVFEDSDTLTYSALSVSFLVDENLENYREIHGWLTGLGFPRSHDQFQTFINAGNDRFPTGNATANSREAGRVDDGGFDVGASYSDATLTILSSKNNPVLEVRFRDSYPTSLSGLTYDQQAGDTSYLTGDVSFSYNIYEFATVGSATTTETTT